MPIPLLFPIDLTQRPHLAACATNLHSGTERFRLAQHWSLHIYQYHARLTVAAAPFDIVPGSMTLVPPDTPIEYRYQGPSRHIFAHFTLPSPAPTPSQLALPVFYDVRRDFQHFEQEMEAIAEALLLNPLRAEIKLWDLLWELAEYAHNTAPQHHPSLEKALHLIESRLSEDISVTALAREVGLSHNHLTRLFRQATGDTVVAYVRHQRAERAKHLLAHTTMPLKVIAAQINSADLQSFSALIKKETGHAPSHWRQKPDIEAQ
ncbi:AraC family transcriptional regulator [bacterium]|nr:MAG: AraC family transcriptional regulator [bacterium]